MKELTNNEILAVSGGWDNDGYNFSFIIENTVTGCCIGLGASFITGNYAQIPVIGAIFGGYATVMMIAKAIDNAI